jgi:hypothetical protein
MDIIFIKNGVKYNYKKCCIQSFIKEDFNNVNCGMFQGTKKEGFIPCNKCYKTIIDIFTEDYKDKITYGKYCKKYAFNVYNIF